MKKRTNKILALLLAATMVLGMVSGCGSKEEPKPQEPDTSNQETPVEDEVAELEEATIQLWLMGPGKQEDSEKVWEAFNEKLQEYVPNTTVEFAITPANEYKTPYEQMLASGEPVDLAWVGYMTSLQKDIDDGNLMALDDLVAEYGSGIAETLGQDVLDLHRNYADGKLYYMPSWQGLLGNRRAYYVPTEFAELAGDTWTEDTTKAVDKLYNNYESTADLDAVMEQWDKYFGAAQADGRLYSGLSYYFVNYNSYYGVNENIASVGRIGVQRGDDTYTVQDMIASDYVKTFFSWMADFYKKGYWRSDVASIDMGTVKFPEGGEYNDLTTLVFAHNYLTEDSLTQYETKAGVELTAIPMEEKTTLVKGNATAMAIPYCADEPERAMMVLDAIYTVPELYQLLIYGIEGEHYTDNGDGTITTPYGSQGTAEDKYGLIKWTIGTCENSLVTQADSEGYYDRLKEGEKDAINNPFINFSFDRTNVESQISALAAVESEYFSALFYGINGDNWEAVYEKFLAEREGVGVDEIIAEFQRQLDEYIAENNIK